MSGDVFEFSLDDLVEAEEPDLYPALPPREKGGAPSDSIDFEIVNESLSDVTSIPASSPVHLSHQHRKTLPEEIASHLNLDAVKLHTMQSAFAASPPASPLKKPRWLDELPSAPQAAAVETPADLEMALVAAAPAKRVDVVPMRHQLDPQYDASRLSLVSSGSYRVGFGPGLRFAACNGTRVRVVRLQCADANDKLLAAHSRAVEEYVPRRPALYQSTPGDVWHLMTILFDPVYSSSDVDLRNALSNWLQAALSNEGRGKPGDHFLDQIADAVRYNRISRAVEIAIDNRCPRLATIIAESASGLRGHSRQVMREQLRKWSLTGVWASMTPSNRRVYALLAGDAGPSSGWLSALSAAVWLSDRSVRPLAEMLHGVDGPYDVRLALLRVRSNRLLPPHAVLRNAPVAIDHAVQFHMFDALQDALPLQPHQREQLAMAYAGQLEAQGRIRDALYVTLCIIQPDNAKRVQNALIDILTRNYPPVRPTSLPFNSVRFGMLPSSNGAAEPVEPGPALSPWASEILDWLLHWSQHMPWARGHVDAAHVVYASAYARAIADGCPSLALTFAIRAGLWAAAHALFVTDIGPDLLLHRQFDAVARIGAILKSKQRHYPMQWRTGGAVLLAMAQGVAVEDSQLRLDAVPHTPRTAEGSERLRLKQRALKLSMPTAGSTPTRMERLHEMTAALIH
ncbi:Nuclear pore complex protein NUP96 C-terminal domain-containing protein [Plasmodiophora brassicae]